MEKDGKKRRHVIFKEKKISRDEFMAASIGDCEWLEQSLRDGHSPNTFDRHGLAPIHLAALHGRLGCLKLLVEKYKVDVNLPSSHGWRPLHLAINKDIEERALLCVNYLLENGADVNCTNDENVTTTHQAATAGLVNCLLVLFDNDAPVEVEDARHKTPYKLAKLWGHKECARLIKLEEWKRQKELDDIEKKKLNNLKSKYIELQQEALHQLQNEQEFFDSITFGNWLEKRGFSDRFIASPPYVNDRHSQHVTNNLAQRLRLSGPMEDYATRVENLYTEKKSHINREMSVTANKSKATADKKSTLSKHHTKQKGALQSHTPKHISGQQKRGEIKPSKDTSHLRKQNFELKQVEVELPLHVPDWNFSTNVNTAPITNIQNPQLMSLSTKPSEDAVSVLPPTVNLAVYLHVDKDNKLALRIMKPGGILEDANIAIPSLPPDVIREVLHGKEQERIRIPQEFESVHIFDVKHKGRPKSSLSTEVPWHLKMFKDGRCIESNCIGSTCDNENPR